MKYSATCNLVWEPYTKVCYCKQVVPTKIIFHESTSLHVCASIFEDLATVNRLLHKLCNNFPQTIQSPGIFCPLGWEAIQLEISLNKGIAQKGRGKIREVMGVGGLRPCLNVLDPYLTDPVQPVLFYKHACYLFIHSLTD